MPPTAPRFSVIVPAGDRPPTLPLCVSAIEGASGAGDEVIVVEQGGIGPAEARNRLREAFARDQELIAAFGAYDDRPAAPNAVSGFRNLLHHWVHRRGAGAAT